MRNDPAADQEQPQRQRLVDTIRRQRTPGLLALGIHMLCIVVTGVAVVSIMISACGAERRPPDPERHLLAPTTTMTTVKPSKPPKPSTTTIPDPNLQVATERQWDSNQKLPNGIEFLWHGKLDGYDCILIEDHDSPALWCNPNLTNGYTETPSK